MKHTSITVVCLAILFLVTGCYPITVVEVVNHSDQTLTVISMDMKLKESIYLVEKDQTARIKVPHKLRVKCGEETWDYDLPPTKAPPNFRKKIPNNRYIEKFQIEQDGSLNRLYPDAEGPVEDPPVQPPGYPVRPK